MIDKTTEDKMIFACSCVESAARELCMTPREMFMRMEAVNLINGYILKHYDVIHAESRKNITEDIIGCLLDWEKRKSEKEAAIC